MKPQLQIQNHLQQKTAFLIRIGILLIVSSVVFAVVLLSFFTRKENPAPNPPMDRPSTSLPAPARV